MGGFQRWLRDVLPPVILILAIDLVVTVAFFAASGSSARTGTLRPVSTLPAKAVELAFVGGGIGLAACLTARRFDLPLMTLAVAFVALLDADHLPSVFGFEQPIRPTHSLAFLAVEVAALLVAFRGRPELVLLAASAFFGHVAGDTGIFALLAPFSFAYASIEAYRVPFALAAVAFALATGDAHRRAQKGRVTGALPRF